MTNETLPEQRPSAPETPTIGVVLATLDDALRCAISALPGLKTPGALPHNLHVAVRAASDVRSLLEMGGEGRTDDDATKMARLERMHLDLVDRLFKHFEHCPEMPEHLREAGAKDAESSRRSAAMGETVDESSGREGGSLVLDASDRQDARSHVLAIETALRSLLDVVDDDGQTLKDLQSIARSATCLRCNLGLGEVSS